MVYRRIGRGATAHSTASQWLTPTRNSGSLDTGTMALTQRNIQLGLFIRSLVGLDRQAATQAFSRYLVDTAYSAAQVDFVNLIVSELTANGVMESSRLYESPFTDHAQQGPDLVFTDQDLDIIIDTLNQVRGHAVPETAQ